jgi:hypothetical protein
MRAAEHVTDNSVPACIMGKNEITPDMNRYLTNEPVVFTLGDGLGGEICLDKDFESVTHSLRVLIPQSRNAIFKCPERIQAVKDFLVNQYPG